jgi:sRNA-binding carbon storage regulator CsrA
MNGRLYLKRSVNEKILVILEDGRTLLFTICDIANNSTVVKINAPTSIKVLRHELIIPPKKNQSDA